MIPRICNHPSSTNRYSCFMNFEDVEHCPRLLASSSAVLALVLILGGSTIVRADAVSELASFSIFDKVDLAQLAKSDVKTAHGPPMSNPRFLAVQSCYVVAGGPAQQAEAVRRRDATKTRGLEGFLTSGLSSNSTPPHFEKRRKAP